MSVTQSIVWAILSPVLSAGIVGTITYFLGLARGRRKRPVWVLLHVTGDDWTMAYTGPGRARIAEVHADTLGISPGQPWPWDGTAHESINHRVPPEPENGKQYPLSGLPEGRGIIVRWLEGRYLCEGTMVVRAGDQRVEMPRSDVKRDRG